LSDGVHIEFYFINVLQTQQDVLYKGSQEGIHSLEMEIFENITIAFMNKITLDYGAM